MKLHKLLVLTLAAAAFFSCKRQTLKENIIRPVKISEVRSFGVTTNIYSGIVSPDQFSNLAFKMSGPLISVNVVEGQRVKKGDIIARIDPSDYQIDFDAKRASYLTAESQMQRARKLLAKNAISKQEFESTSASFENARAAYENSKKTLTETTLKAPFDGFIQEKYVENYQEVRTGDRIVCLINPDKLQMQATLPETALSYITHNPEIYVEFDSYKGKKFKAQIKEYVQSSPDGSGIPIYVSITDPAFNLSKYKVAVGFSCTIELVVKDIEALGWTFVPLSAIVETPDSAEKSVFIYNFDTKTVSQRIVKDAGIVNKTAIVITEGLQVGEFVVSAGATRVIEGQRVKLLNE